MFEVHEVVGEQLEEDFDVTRFDDDEDDEEEDDEDDEVCDGEHNNTVPKEIASSLFSGSVGSLPLFL